jgi:hypothetical protein
MEACRSLGILRLKQGSFQPPGVQERAQPSRYTIGVLPHCQKIRGALDPNESLQVCRQDRNLLSNPQDHLDSEPWPATGQGAVP